MELLECDQNKSSNYFLEINVVCFCIDAVLNECYHDQENSKDLVKCSSS